MIPEFWQLNESDEHLTAFMRGCRPRETVHVHVMRDRDKVFANSQLSWNGDRLFRGHLGPVNCMCFHKQQVFSGSEDGTVRRWALTNHSIWNALSELHSEGLAAVSFAGKCSALYEGHCGGITAILLLDIIDTLPLPIKGSGSSSSHMNANASSSGFGTINRSRNKGSGNSDGGMMGTVVGTVVGTVLLQQVLLLLQRQQVL